MHLGAVTLGRGGNVGSSGCQRGNCTNFGSDRRMRAGRNFVHVTCGCSGRCWRCGCWSRSGAGHFQLEDKITGANFVFQCDADAFHHAGSRRGDFHAGLVRLQGDQRLISFDAIADLDQNLDDLGFAVRADVWHMYVLHAAAGLRGWCRCGGRSGSSSCFRCFCRCCGRRRWCLGSAFGFQLKQFVAFFQAVAQLYFQTFHHTAFRRGDFHAGLVRLQGQHALIGLDAITDLDHQFDYFTLTTTDVGYANQFTHRFAP